MPYLDQLERKTSGDQQDLEMVAEFLGSEENNVAYLGIIPYIIEQHLSDHIIDCRDRPPCRNEPPLSSE